MDEARAETNKAFHTAMETAFAQINDDATLIGALMRELTLLRAEVARLKEEAAG